MRPKWYFSQWMWLKVADKCRMPFRCCGMHVQHYSQSCRPHGSQQFHDFDWYNSCGTQKCPLAVNGSRRQEPPLGGVPAGGFVGTAGNKGAGGFVNSAVSIVSMVTYTSDLNPYLCSSMNSGANHLTGTRFCNSCSVSKYISHKYAFQWDVYCPLISRMPAWGWGG